MTNYKNRKAVPTKYKWDLEFLLEGKTPEQAMKALFTTYKQLIKVKESRYATEENFGKALKIEDKLIVQMNKFSNYLSNKTNENITDPTMNKLAGTFDYEMQELSKQMGATTPIVFANEKKIRTYLKKEKYASYRKDYEKIFETKKHQLPKQIQEYRNKSARGDSETSTPFSILSDAELVFKDAEDSKGKLHKVGHANISKLMQHKDATLRKNASIEYRNGYLNVKQTLSNFLFQHFKGEVVEAQLHKFDGIMEYLLFSDRSNTKLLESLYKAVQDNVGVYKQFRKAHKVAYKAKYKKPITKYDMRMPIASVKTNLTIEEQKQLVLDALKPFGKEYTDVVKKAFKDKWIDFAPYKGKRTGAYSIGGTYGVDKKLILMNNTNDIPSAETLAHELGHSLHSYFSDKANHARLSAYKIFVAEIASIFNELMFFDHILNTSKDKQLKLQILHQIGEGFDGTVFRQTMFSNYEHDVYKAIEKGVPASNYETLSKIYIENAKKYSDSTKDMKPEEAYNAIRIPHYYYGFYVYKYSIGQLVANIFFRRYKKEGPKALQSFIKNFLSIGNSMDPLETLKHNGIDLEDPKSYQEGFDAFSENVKEYKKLIKEIYKK